MSFEILAAHLTQPATLFHLNGDADESRWGRSVGFPVLLFRSDELDEEAYQELSDAYGDALFDAELELFDEEGWTSTRLKLIGLCGVFDDPGEEVLQSDFPYVAQMDGLLLWDEEQGAVRLLDGDVSGDGDFDRMLPVVASSADELLAVLDPR